MGYMNGAWVDVHGAGAQRSDPKSGDPASYPNGRGPQGDAIRISNYVRVVRGGMNDSTITASTTTTPIPEFAPAIVTLVMAITMIILSFRRDRREPREANVIEKSPNPDSIVATVVV
jgi:hypothetical protein